MKDLIIKKCAKCGAEVLVIEDCKCEACGITCCGEKMEVLDKELAEKELKKVIE